MNNSPENRHLVETGDLISCYGMTNKNYTEDRLRLQLACMKEWGWKPEDTVSDIDELDIRGDSLNVGVYIGEGDERKLGASMRVTKFAYPSDSLSISMLDSNPDMRDEAVQYMLNQPSPKNGSIYDVTRLVTDREFRHSGVRALLSVVELFGYAHGQLANDPHQGDDDWYFLTTGPMLEVIQKSGFTTTVISSGLVSVHDTEKSYFCHVKPTEAYNNTGVSRNTILVHNIVSRGIEYGEKQKALHDSL